MFFKLDNKNVKVENLVHNSTVIDPNEIGKIYTGNNPTLQEHGRVVGTAVYFFGKRKIKAEELFDLTPTSIKEVEQEHRLLVYAPGAPHDYILRYLASEMNYISAVNDPYTHYGFITEKSYFVDRICAAKLYLEFLKKEGHTREHDRLVEKHLHSLNSYHVDWNLIR